MRGQWALRRHSKHEELRCTRIVGLQQSAENADCGLVPETEAEHAPDTRGAGVVATTGSQAELKPAENPSHFSWQARAFPILLLKPLEFLQQVCCLLPNSEDRTSGMLLPSFQM